MTNHSDEFNRWWDFVLKWEGTYSNDPADPGGETKWGISRRAHGEISDEDWRNFTLDKAKAIAHADYWVVCHCDNIRTPLCYYMADTAFNMGVGVASHLYHSSDEGDDFLFARIALYAKMKHANIFLRGWINRVLDLRQTFKGVA